MIRSHVNILLFFDFLTLEMLIEGRKKSAVMVMNHLCLFAFSQKWRVPVKSEVNAILSDVISQKQWSVELFQADL